MENQETSLLAIVGIDYLKPTNPNVDWEYINALAKGIRKGEIDPEQEPPLYVGVRMGEGYFVNDGNHHYHAYKMAGVKAVLSEVYPIGGEAQESVRKIFE